LGIVFNPQTFSVHIVQYGLKINKETLFIIHTESLLIEKINKKYPVNQMKIGVPAWI